MNPNDTVIARSPEQVLAANKTIRNTYTLLSMTLIFSAVMAVVSTAMNVSFMTGLIADIVAIVMLWFVLPRTANSGTGIGVLFAITGLLGFGLGPLLAHYLSAFSNGGQLIATAAGGTGVIFLGLSAYAMQTRKDFSFMGGFLAAGMIVVLLAIIGNLFFQIPALHLAINAVVIMLMAGFILYETSQLIHDPSVNYIMMAASMFLSILNLFTSLLQLLGALSGDD